MGDDDSSSLALAAAKDTKRGLCSPQSRLQWVQAGFDTADLKDAKALLDELSESR